MTQKRSDTFEGGGRGAGRHRARDLLCDGLCGFRIAHCAGIGVERSQGAESVVGSNKTVRINSTPDNIGITLIQTTCIAL